MAESMVLEQIKETAREVLPKDAKLFLFGSRARGDARNDSDWDLLIILNKDKRGIDDIRNYACPFMELGYTIEKEINPVIYTKKEWDKRRFTLFHHFIEKERIELCR